LPAATRQPACGPKQVVGAYFYRGRTDFFVADDDLACFDGAFGARLLESSGQLVFSHFNQVR